MNLPELALTLAGVGHFCILLASFQVPSRLKWKEELARLSPLNRKLMWVYGAFTVLTIVAFGTLTLSLREEMLAGEKAATALAAFIAIYWFARIGVELFCFEPSDWPPGKWIAAGRLLLLGLFTAIASTYMALVVVTIGCVFA